MYIKIKSIMSYTTRLIQQEMEVLPDDSHMSGDITLCGTTTDDKYIAPNGK